MSSFPLNYLFMLSWLPCPSPPCLSLLLNCQVFRSHMFITIILLWDIFHWTFSCLGFSGYEKVQRAVFSSSQVQDRCRFYSFSKFHIPEPQLEPELDTIISFLFQLHNLIIVTTTRVRNLLAAVSHFSIIKLNRGDYWLITINCSHRSLLILIEQFEIAVKIWSHSYIVIYME